MGLGSAVVQLISNVARCGAAIVERLNLPEKRRKAAAKDVAKEEADRAASVSDTAAAVFDGDKDAVNRQVTRILGLLVVAVSLVAGCVKTPAVCYVPADREVVPMIRTNGVSNVAGWFVPNATFFELLKKSQRATELEKEMAVSARMDGKR